MKKTQLSSSEKTAIVMVALGEELASTIMKQLDQNEARKVSLALSRLGRVGQETIDAVMEEFSDILKKQTSINVQGGVKFAEKVLTKAFKGDQFSSELIENLRSHAVDMKSLDLADGATIARLISNEHPQTIAMVLAFADSVKAGQILKCLADGIRLEVIKRLASMGPIDTALVEQVDEQLRKDLLRLGERSKQNLGGIKKVAAILNTMDDSRRNILDKLEERDPDLSEQIKQEMFTFQDLLKLDDASMGRLFKECKRDLWPLALRGVNAAIKDKVRGQLSSRAAQMLEDDMEALGPQRLQDVRDAQNQILETAQQLLETGEIQLMDPNQLVV